jgi:PEP-CTERM/exosortase A-associated glycosyltransferase
MSDEHARSAHPRSLNPSAQWLHFPDAFILREQRKLGWQTFHLTTPKQVDCQCSRGNVDGWHFYRTAAPSLAGVRLPGIDELAMMRQVEKRLMEVVKLVKPDILHAHSPVLNAIPALRVGKRLGLPVAYEVRAFWEDAAVDHGTTTEGSLRYRLTRRLETHALKRADHVFTICDGLRNDIVARGVPAEKVTVIANAVDIDSFSVGGEPNLALKERLGLQGATVIGFIGSFYAYEGLDLLLDALPRILRERPEVRVLLVGGGPQEQALKQQLDRLGLTRQGGVHRSRPARRSPALLRSGRRPGLPSPFNAPHRTGDTAQAAWRPWPRDASLWLLMSADTRS